MTIPEYFQPVYGDGGVDPNTTEWYDPELGFLSSKVIPKSNIPTAEIVLHEWGFKESPHLLYNPSLSEEAFARLLTKSGVIRNFARFIVTEQGGLNVGR